MNESCLTNEWVMSHICRTHVSHTDEWVTLNMQLRHVSHTNESFHTWMSRVTPAEAPKSFGGLWQMTDCPISCSWPLFYRYIHYMWAGILQIRIRIHKFLSIWCWHACGRLKSLRWGRGERKKRKKRWEREQERVRENWSETKWDITSSDVCFILPFCWKKIIFIIIPGRIESS